ncbi:DUF1513 domain-containing protein [Bradyrhizobium sp. WSM1743]|uniref:DUF1513 domain-containing protein n=1 Tax=Bradyrhizobium sp. WSM1743 TaxID=318996 RepID=UPI001FD98200|nr:DUF1513 domain-containing protein [Bradyrhizobium sp. WSM1743]
MGTLARSNLLPSKEVLINNEHETDQLRAAKRPRTLENPQGIAIERQLSDVADSGGGGGAMPAASALQPAQSMGIVIRGHQRDMRPVYSEDASAILGLEEALIKGGMPPSGVKQHVSALLSYSRWLFEKRRPSIVARMDSNSLSDGGDVREFVGKGNPARLIAALDHLRTFRSTGEVKVVVRPRSGRAKLNPATPNVAPIHSESAALMEQRRLDNAVAQPSARSAPQPGQSTGIVRGHDMRPPSEDAPVVPWLEKALIEAGTRRLDIAAAQLSASSALRPAQSRGVVTGGDMRPLYFEDARDISGLQEAFIKAGLPRDAACQYASPLRSFGRWLFAKNKPSLVVQLDSGSLSGDVSGFMGKRNPDRLLRAINHLRTFRSTGTIVRPFTKRDPHPSDAAPIHPESAVLMEPRRLDHAIAQHSALQQASRPEEIRGLRDDQPAPSAFVQGQVAFDPEQISQEELRQVLDNQPIPSPVSVSSEELQRLEKDVHDELDVRTDDHPAQSFSVDPEEFTFNLDQFSPGELRRLIDDDSAQLAELQERRNDQPAPSAFVQGQVAFDPEQISQEELRRVLDHLDNPIPSPVSVPTEELQRLENDLHDELDGRRDAHPAQNSAQLAELQERRNDQPAPSAFVEGQVAFDPEQISQEELRRLLDHLDNPIQPPVSAPSEELQRLENDVHEELDVRGDDHRAQSFSIDPEEFSFNLEEFSPGELRRLIDDDSAQLGYVRERWNDQPAPSAFVEGQVAFDPEQISQEELRQVLDHPDNPIQPPVSVPLEELQRLENDLHDELDGRRDDHRAQSFSIDPEESTFNQEQFSPGELRRLLDDGLPQLEVDRLARQSLTLPPGA